MHVLNRTSFAGGGLCRFSLSHLFTSVQFSGPLLGEALRLPRLNHSAEFFYPYFCHILNFYRSTETLIGEKMLSPFYLFTSQSCSSEASVSNSWVVSSSIYIHILNLISLRYFKNCWHFFLIYLNCSITVLQCCVSFPCTAKWISCMYTDIWASLVFSGKDSSCQCRRHRFDPWVGKIP